MIQTQSKPQSNTMFPLKHMPTNMSYVPFVLCLGKRIGCSAFGAIFTAWPPVFKNNNKYPSQNKTPESLATTVAWWDWTFCFAQNSLRFRGAWKSYQYVYPLLFWITFWFPDGQQHGRSLAQVPWPHFRGGVSLRHKTLFDLSNRAPISLFACQDVPVHCAKISQSLSVNKRKSVASTNRPKRGHQWKQLAEQYTRSSRTRTHPWARPVHDLWHSCKARTHKK